MGASIAAIIASAGASTRMADETGGKKKEYLELPFFSKEGEPLTVLGAVVTAFSSCSGVGPIIISVPPGGESVALASLPAKLRYAEETPHGRIIFVAGGPTRRSSVHNALSRLEEPDLRSLEVSYVLIHDGARPWVSHDLIERIIEAAIRFGAAIPALPLTETPKELYSRELRSRELGSQENETCEEVKFIKRHLKRTELCGAQTPQGFKFPDILRAHEKAAEREKRENLEYTDDAEVWGEFIGKVAVIAGDHANRKITYPGDL